MFIFSGGLWKMKLFALLSTRKNDKKVANHADLEEGIEQDALVEKSKQEKVVAKPENEDTCSIIIRLMFNLTFYLILIGILTAFYHWVPRSYTDNGNPNRTVHLNRSDDGYGLAINAWHAISEISPGSAAGSNGEIVIGEELLTINGVSLEGTAFSNTTIQSLLNTRYDGVELIVAPLHKDPLWICFARAVAVALACFLMVILENPIRRAWNWWKCRGTVTRAVMLTKTEGCYGFTMSNGKITEITPGGSMCSQSDLMKGDVIVTVNGVDVEGLEDRIIFQICKTRNSSMHLVVRRKIGK